MSGAFGLLIGVAAVVVATALLVLVTNKRFGRAAINAGPVTVEFSAVEKLEAIHAELQPNGGASTRDAINRIERSVSELGDRMTALEEVVTQPPRR